MIRSELALLLLTAVSTSAQQATPAAKPYAGLVTANTRFAFKLFHESVARGPEQNVLLSPTALSLDFALLQNAADTAARGQIVSVFEFGDWSPETINEQSQALRHALIYDPVKPTSRAPRRHGVQPPPICCPAPPEHLALAGSLWVQPIVTFRRKFLETNEKFFGFKIASAPGKGAEGTRAVNDWVSKETRGQLTNALDSWRRDDFLVVDTTSFKGSWFRPFDESRTHRSDFTLFSGQKKSVNMMVQGGDYNYLRGDKFQAIRLNYGHAAMYVFLPDVDSDLPAFERSLTADNWADWLSKMEEHEGSIELPRFSADYEGYVTKILVDLGMPLAFTSFQSFVPLVENPEGARLTRVLQAVTIKVDEKGTEAASATFIGGVIGGVSSGPRPTPFRMVVDHPFFFAICDDETNAILYMGAINDPSPIPLAH